ncbi:transcription initiation factor TFIID subunit 4-like [Neosynchiropus ocellatus]
MDAPTDCTAGRDTDKPLVTGGVTSPSGNGEKENPSQTHNGSHIVNSHSSGSVATPTGPGNDAPSAAAVNSGPVLSKKPPASNSVIQTPHANSQSVIPATTVALSSPSAPAVANGGSEGRPAAGTSPAQAGAGTPLTQGASAAGTDVSTVTAEAPTAHTQPPQQQVSAGTINTPRAPAQGGIQAMSQQMMPPRLPQASPGQPSIHNIQLPPGMVLVRSESGQLLMIPQQALAQVQAQAQAQAQSQGNMAPRTTMQTNVSSAQSPVSTIINRQVTPTTIIRQSGPTPASLSPATTLQRPPFLQRSVVTAVPGITTGAIGQPSGTTVTSITMSKETMENVKKCKNFLSTLIKLASTGKQSTETAATVRQLVKDLLESKLEAEEFTSRLYKELNSSPQPYLVPFLKRSLPALRQLTPDATAFIQQSQLPQPPSASVSSTVATPTTVVLGSPGPRLSVPVTRPQLQPSVVKQGQTHTLVLQHPQQRAIMRPPTVSSLAIRNQAPGRIVFGQPHLQLQPFPVRPDGARQMSAAALTPFQKNKIKEAGGTFKDDDDINDVASMAGVNLSEESANILATNSGLVGAVMRSCKDEPFLSHALLQRRILEIGKRFGVMDVGAEVVTFVSHAIQQRLQDLLEKVTYVAQQKVGPFKEEDDYEQTSDVRSQLKFFEQLDLLEKQKKEEQEREILLKAAKSRARQEDPEQLRLKQKAKEMQQQELAQLRQREANMTALAAIGPRKKKKILDSSSSAAAPEGSETGSSVSGGAGSSGSRPTRQRITRVNLRDLLFCLENERFTSRSHFLYKGFLKQV